MNNFTLITLLITLTLISCNQSIKSKEQAAAKKWNFLHQKALQFYLNEKSSEFYEALFSVANDKKEDLLSQKVASENIGFFYNQGNVYSPKGTHDSAINQINFIVSTNKSIGFTPSNSIDLEILTKKSLDIKKVSLSLQNDEKFNFQPPASSKINNSDSMLIYKFETIQLSQILSSGLYILKVEHTLNSDYFFFYYNANTVIESELPPYPRITKIDSRHRLVKWSSYRSPTFLKERDHQRVLLALSKDNNYPHQFLEDDGRFKNQYSLDVDPNEKVRLYFGISYLERHAWGRLQHIQALNYRIPIN